MDSSSEKIIVRLPGMPMQQSVGENLPGSLSVGHAGGGDTWTQAPRGGPFATATGALSLQDLGRRFGAPNPSSPTLPEKMRAEIAAGLRDIHFEEFQKESAPFSQREVVRGSAATGEEETTSLKAATESLTKSSQNNQISPPVAGPTNPDKPTRALTDNLRAEITAEARRAHSEEFRADYGPMWTERIPKTDAATTKEIAMWRRKVDELARQFKKDEQEVKDLKLELAAERTRRFDNTQSLQSELETEQKNRADDKNSLQSQLDAEKTKGVDVAQLLQAQLDDERAQRIEVAQSWQARLEAEHEERVEEVKSLQSELDKERTSRNEEKLRLHLQLEKEQASRFTEVQSLQTSLNNERTRRSEEAQGWQLQLEVEYAKLREYQAQNEIIQVEWEHTLVDVSVIDQLLGSEIAIGGQPPYAPIAMLPIPPRHVLRINRHGIEINLSLEAVGATLVLLLCILVFPYIRAWGGFDAGPLRW